MFSTLLNTRSSRAFSSRSFTTRVQTPRTSRFLAGKHVLASGQFDRNQIEELLDVATFLKREVQEKGGLDILKNKVSCNLFYEASTRTTGSFHSAMMRAGGQVLPVYTQFSSVQKGETLEDTIRTVQNFVDVIVIRHPEIGSAARAAAVAAVPIINCGDGANEHPTQALLDLLCIKSELGKIDGLTIAMVGDLKYGRTVHSLSKLLSHFNVKLEFVAPKELMMPEKVTKDLKANKVVYNETTDLQAVLPKCDVMYMTRVQKERFDTIEEYNRVKDSYIINRATLAPCKPTMCLMHPLPRVNEIDPDVDADPRAKYFKQPEYGMYMRMTLLAAVLGAV